MEKARQLQQKVETEKTLKSIIGGGLFGGRAKKPDAIYFGADARAYAEQAAQIAAGLTSEQVSELAYGINDEYMRPVKRDCEAWQRAQAVRPAHVIAQTGGYFDAKDLAKREFAYVIWARRGEDLYVMPVHAHKAAKL